LVSCGFPPLAMAILLASRGTNKLKATVAFHSQVATRERGLRKAGFDPKK
jgi:hypothetical protein